MKSWAINGINHSEIPGGHRAWFADKKLAGGAVRDPSWVGFGPNPNQAMIGEFVASIREKRDPSITWNDGYQAMRVALAAYESNATHSPVRLDS